MDPTPKVVPPLTIGLEPVMNGGAPNVRLTNPSLYRYVLLSCAVSLAMAANFALLSPTFLIYGQSNYLWAGAFATGGVSAVGALIWRKDRLLRLLLWMLFVYLVGITLGTMQPWREGTGSLQLPILYGAWAALSLLTLLDPIINPWTARRDKGGD